MKLVTIAALGVFSLTAFTVSAARPTVNDINPVADRSIAGLDCETEAIAFAEVADLAYAFGNSGDVFSGALLELRDQLLDCLIVENDDANDSSFPFRGKLGSFSGIDEQRSI